MRSQVKSVKAAMLIYFIIGAVWMYRSKAWISSGVMVVVVDMVV